MFSYCFAKFLNKVIPERVLTWYVIDRWGNEYERLYLDSMGSEEFGKKLLMITTESGKVYVGYILRITKPLLYHANSRTRIASRHVRQLRFSTFTPRLPRSRKISIGQSPRSRLRRGLRC